MDGELWSVFEGRLDMLRVETLAERGGADGSSGLTMLPGGQNDLVVPAFEAGSLGFLAAETFQWLGTLASQDRE